MAYGDAIWTDAQQNGTKPPEQAVDETIAQEEVARKILEPDPPIPVEAQTNGVYLRLGRYYRIKGELFEAAGRRDDAVPFYEKSLDVLHKAEELDQPPSSSCGSSRKPGGSRAPGRTCSLAIFRFHRKCFPKNDATVNT